MWFLLYDAHIVYHLITPTLVIVHSIHAKDVIFIGLRDIDPAER